MTEERDKEVLKNLEVTFQQVLSSFKRVWQISLWMNG